MGAKKKMGLHSNSLVLNQANERDKLTKPVPYGDERPAITNDHTSLGRQVNLAKKIIIINQYVESKIGTLFFLAPF